MKHRTVIDSRFDGLDGDAIDIADARSCRDWVARALDDEIEVAIVVGDDASLAQVASAQADLSKRRSEALSFALLAAGDLNCVASAVGASSASSRAERKLLRRIEGGRAERRTVGTLRVVDSVDPRPQLAFSFGMGALTELAAAGRVRRRDAVRSAVGGSTSVEAVVRIDWEEVATSFGYLLASSLEQSWARVKMGKGSTVRLGSSPLQLLRGGTRLGRAVERAAGGTATGFGCVHIDTNSDYVVDGLTRSAVAPRMIAVTTGPQVRVLV